MTKTNVLLLSIFWQTSYELIISNLEHTHRNLFLGIHVDAVGAAL